MENQFAPLPKCILQYLMEFLDNQVFFKNLCKYNFYKLTVYKLPKIVKFNKVLKWFTDIKILNCSNNKNIKNKYLVNHNNIIELDISNSSVSYLPRSLIKLNVSKNRRIKNAGIKNLTKLQWLNISYTGIYELPANIEYLNCFCNSIIHNPDITGLPLKVLKAGMTDITIFPASLTDLNIYGNTAVKNHHLKHLINLRRLNIGLTRITYVPAGVIDLNCENNYAIESKDIKHLINLKWINIKNTNLVIKDIPKGCMIIIL